VRQWLNVSNNVPSLTAYNQYYIDNVSLAMTSSTQAVLITGALSSNTGNGAGSSPGFTKVDGASLYITIGYGTSAPGNATNIADRSRSTTTPLINNVNNLNLEIDGRRIAGCTPYRIVTVTGGNTGAVDMFPFTMPFSIVWTGFSPTPAQTVYFSLWIQSTKNIAAADLAYNLVATQLA
jgi:hypothetical protein